MRQLGQTDKQTSERQIDIQTERSDRETDEQTCRYIVSQDEQ